MISRSQREHKGSFRGYPKQGGGAVFSRLLSLESVQSLPSNYPLLKYRPLSTPPKVLSKYRFHLAATHEFGFPLMPLIFFYDKPHVCCARYYREAVFGEGSMLDCML